MANSRSLLGLLLPFFASGCLYTGEVNGRPSVSLQLISNSSAASTLGKPFEIIGYIDDDQADGQALAVLVRDESGAVVTDPCVVSVLPLGTIARGGPEYEVTIWQAGTYTIEGTPSDRYGASGSSSSVRVTVTDAPPTFATATDQLHTGAPRTACTSLYPTGIAIPVRLDSMLVDPEASWQPPPEVCSVRAVAPLVRTWHITDRPIGSAATLGRAMGDVCPVAPLDPSADLVDPSDVVCFYSDPNLPTGTPSIYTLALEISDGSSVRRSDSLMIPVIGDAPACLDGTYPAVGSYVLARDVATAFQAVGTDDVSATGSLAFVWSIERPGTTGFVALDAPVLAIEGGNHLSFDPIALGLSVGDKLRLRVEVSDPADKDAIACEPSDDSCAAASCAAAPATTCPRRATWSLEIR